MGVRVEEARRAKEEGACCSCKVGFGGTVGRVMGLGKGVKRGYRKGRDRAQGN